MERAPVAELGGDLLDRSFPEFQKLPGVIETDRNTAALSDAAFAGRLRDAIPMHRFGSAEECAEAIAFLASEAAGYITGAEIPLAGGWQL